MEVVAAEPWVAEKLRNMAGREASLKRTSIGPRYRPFAPRSCLNQVSFKGEVSCLRVVIVSVVEFAFFRDKDHD